jgi:hypothetical protein
MAAQSDRVLWQARTGEDADMLQAGVDQGLAVPLLGHHGDGLKRFGRARGQAAPAAARHQRGQARHPIDKARRHDLADHAAHGRADHVGLADAEGVEEPDRVRRHVIEEIGHLGLHSGRDQLLCRRHVGQPGGIELARQPHVPVVESEHPETGRQQAVDELVGPVDELHAETVDEQDHRRGLRTAQIVFDGEAVGPNCRHAADS